MINRNNHLVLHLENHKTFYVPPTQADTNTSHTHTHTHIHPVLFEFSIFMNNICRIRNNINGKDKEKK